MRKLTISYIYRYQKEYWLLIVLDQAAIDGDLWVLL